MDRSLLKSNIAPPQGHATSIRKECAPLRHLIAIALIVLACVVFGFSRRAAAELDGGCLYRMHCASCHGPVGRGDGPDATIFAPPPTDLRDFVKRSNMKDLARRVREGLPLELTLDAAVLRSQTTQVEEILSHIRHLPYINWRLADDGEAIFLCRCEECHGPHGKPGATLPLGVQRPRDLSDPSFRESVRDTDLIRLARHGRKGMPALVPRVSEQEGRALVAYVRLLSPGFDLYSRYCANCHGDDGRGRSSVGEVVHPPAIIFDRSYFSRTDAERLRAAVWHMVGQHKPSMPHYRAKLDAAQAEAIITYLKHVE
ncbi:MAG: c-type cytochrome [Candidatus Binatia bacterium]